MHTTGLDLEDAQILGNLFSRIQDRTQIGRFMTAYDDIRQPRTSSLFKFVEKRREAFMAPKGPLRDLRDLMLSKLSDLLETEDEGLDEGMSFATQYANDMVEDWWNKYGVSLVKVPERRYSVLSNVEISVAKKTLSECPLPSISS
jgi:salicylate hydroxylase